MHAVVSWSGGKDGCLACYKAMSSGLSVTHLLNFVSEDERCMFHGVDSRLMVAQSQAIRIPLIQRKVRLDTYEEEFKAAMRSLKQIGVEGAVFGDIDIEEHRDWVYRVCREIGVTPMEPLWHRDPEQILAEFIDTGFEAIVVNAKADLLGEDWLGRKIDRNFIEDLQGLQTSRKIHLCGESGEYHTLVTDGPIFKQRIRLLSSQKIQREGHWRFWLLNELRFTIEDKS